jgi:hypothetical protein
MTTIYECAFCDNKTSNVSDWGIDFENEYDDRYCGDCFREYYDVCGVCDEYILKEELLDMTDEEGDEYLCCENCKEKKEEKEEEELQRKKWVEDYNKSLPQIKTYWAEFETETSIGVGGIYDSEYMNYVYGGIETPRIKEIKTKQNATKLNDPQKIDSFSKKIDLNKTKETDCINNEMNTEMMNEIAVMSAEDKNVAVAPVAPVAKKEKKPKKECCSCNEMFKDRDLCGDAYGDIWCYDCYDDEYILCFQCNEEIPREKYGDEYWERDGDCYCEGCRDEYDEEEEANKKELEGKVSV